MIGSRFFTVMLFLSVVIHFCLCSTSFFLALSLLHVSFLFLFSVFYSKVPKSWISVLHSGKWTRYFHSLACLYFYFYEDKLSCIIFLCLTRLSISRTYLSLSLRNYFLRIKFAYEPLSLSLLLFLTLPCPALSFSPPSPTSPLFPFIFSPHTTFSFSPPCNPPLIPFHLLLAFHVLHFDHRG